MGSNEQSNTSILSANTDLISRIDDLYYTYQLPAIVFTSLMMLLGLPGNMIVFYIYFFKWCRSTSRMFILFLAGLDMTNCAINLPMEIYIMHFSVTFKLSYLCKVSRYSSYVMNSSSALILVAIAMDRFRRICQPYKKAFSDTQSKYACISAVIFSVASTWPALVLYGVRVIDLGSFKVQTCLLENRFDETIYPVLFLIYMSTMTFLIFTVISVLYYFVGVQIYHHRTFKIRRCTHVEKVVDEQSASRSKCKSDSECNQDISVGSESKGLCSHIMELTSARAFCCSAICRKHDNRVKRTGFLETNIDDVIEAVKCTETSASERTRQRYPQGKDNTDTHATANANSSNEQLGQCLMKQIYQSAVSSNLKECVTSKERQKRRRVRYMLVRNSSTITRSRTAKCVNCITIRIGRSTFMLFLITIAYVTSFMPFYTILLIRQFDTSFLGQVLQSKASCMAYFLIIRSYLISSAINPFIYSFCNAQFRQSCIKTITGLLTGSGSVNIDQNRRQHV